MSTQYRPNAYGASLQAAHIPGWRPGGYAIAAPFHAGLAVTSEATGSTATTVFDGGIVD